MLHTAQRSAPTRSRPFFAAAFAAAAFPAFTLTLAAVAAAAATIGLGCSGSSASTTPSMSTAPASSVAPPPGPPARLLTFDEYARSEHTTPYVMTVGRGDRVLTYYGGRDVGDSGEPAVTDIEARWASAHPRVVFTETPIRGRETALVRQLAERSAVPAMSLSPTAGEEARWLVDKYTKEEIVLFFVLRELPAYNALADKPEFIPYFDTFIEDVGKAIDFPSASYDGVRAEHQKQLGEALVPGAVTREPTDPTKEGLVTQRMAREVTRRNDERMVDVLVEAVRRHGRVFAMAGAAHVIMQEPALRARLEAL